MVSQQEYSPYKKAGRIYAYGKTMPCCPDCGRRMKVHGTYERKLRTSRYPDGIQHVMRVLDCELCRTSHREVPDFIVPRKSYSYDYMCAVVQEEVEVMDGSTYKRIIDLFCALIACLYFCLEAFLHFCGTINVGDFVRKLMENVKITNLLFVDNRDSMDLHFREGDRRVILSAIRRKGVASDDTTKKYGRKICQHTV